VPTAPAWLPRAGLGGGRHRDGGHAAGERGRWVSNVDYALRLMREKAIRRLPVTDRGEIVGMVTIGDIAVARDSQTPLADISAAPPNV
jgi:hypothetical protein